MTKDSSNIPKLLWIIGIEKRETQKGISPGNIRGMEEKSKRGVKIKTPTQNPRHLIQENNLPSIGYLIRKYFLNGSNIDPLITVEVIPHPKNKNKK